MILYDCAKNNDKYNFDDYLKKAYLIDKIKLDEKLYDQSISVKITSVKDQVLPNFKYNNYDNSESDDCKLFNPNNIFSLEYYYFEKIIELLIDSIGINIILFFGIYCPSIRDIKNSNFIKKYIFLENSIYEKFDKDIIYVMSLNEIIKKCILHKEYDIIDKLRMVSILNDKINMKEEIEKIVDDNIILQLSHDEKYDEIIKLLEKDTTY